MRIAIICASPKISSDSASRFIGEAVTRRFAEKGMEPVRLDVRESQSPGNNSRIQAFATMRSADALVFVFPLYIFCVPGLLMRFLQEYARGKDDSVKRVYAIVNCGFPDPRINSEALRVIGRFAVHTGNSYRFGVGLGSGGMLSGARNSLFVRGAMEKLHRAIDLMAEDLLQENAPSDIYIAVRFPRKAYIFMGNRMWRQMARKNGLRRFDLYRKPYAT